MKTVWLLLSWVLWANPALANELDDAARLEFASVLVNVPYHEEEAYSALTLFMAEPAFQDRAGLQLATLLASTPARAGWQDHYGLVEAPEGLRLAFALHAAEARSLDPTAMAQVAQELEALVSQNPGQREPRFVLARLEMRRANPDGAVEALATLDQDQDARGLQVLAYLAQGDQTRANAVAALGLPNANSTLMNALDGGDLSLRVKAVAYGGWPEAAEKILLESDPWGQDLVAWDGLARAWMKRGEPDRAAATWQVVVETAPLDENLRARLVRALIEAGDLPAAIEAAEGGGAESQRLIEAAQLVENALAAGLRQEAQRDEVRRAQELAPELWVVQRAMGILQSSLGEHRRALGNLEASLERVPTDRRALEAHARSCLAVAAPDRMVSRHQIAVRNARSPQERGELADLLSGAHRRAGDHLSGVGQAANALFSWRVALAMAPNNFANRQALAAGLRLAGHLGAAALAYRQLLELEPGRYDLLQETLVIEALRGRSDLALELLDQQRGLPATEEARLIELIERADARFQAQSLREEGDLEGAIAVLQAAAEVWPDDAPIAHALADVFMEDGRPREALPWYGKARSIDPSNIWTVLAEANCLALLTAWDPAAYLLDELGEELDPAQQAMARDIRLRALREEADRLRDSWENKAAFEIYARLLKIEPDADVLTSLGGLYLRQAQPGLAEAFYADALVLDPDNFQAKLGRIRALDQLGRTREGWKLIREMPEDDPDVRDLLEVLEVRMVVQAGDDARIDGRYEDADELLRKLLDRYPLSPDGRALLAALRLDQQRYDEALEIATEVLAEQPVHGRALAVTTEVALFQGRSDLIEELYLSALFDGQELWIRDGLANARLSALVEETERLTNRGEVERARNLVQGATSWLDEDPGRMSLVGRGYLAVGLPDDAELLFDKALVQDPDHSGAIIGKANTKRDRGWVAGAEKYLTIEAVRTEDPLIWMALARVQADRGYRTRAQTSLQQALTLPPAETSLRTWTADGRLPALPLPSGTAPQDLPPTQQAEVMTVMPYTNLQSLEAELSTKDEPGFQAEFGAWSRPGSDGTSNLLAGMGHVGMLDYALPGLVLDVEANPVVATDGWHRVAGVGLGARIRTSPTLPRGASLELGTNPLGFGGFDLHGRLAGRVSLRPGGEFGMSVSRSPITDSVTSWAGIEDADGDDFGRVAFNALSTWLIRDAILSPMDAGLVVHGGLLTGLQLERALRVEAYGWWGWTLDEDIWWARGGLDGYWLSDRPSVDGWAPPDAGAFSPEAFGSLVARVDGEVMLPELPLGLCGGISAGLQVLQQEQVLLDDGEEEIWFDQGLSGIAEARLGGQALLGDQWRLLVEGRWTMVGTVFRERTGVIHLERVSKARRDALPRDALISQGRVPSTLLACKRPTPTAYRPQDYADHVAP